MVLDTGFVTAVLEGIEDTLGELIRARRDFRATIQPRRASESSDSASSIARIAGARARGRRGTGRAGRRGSYLELPVSHARRCSAVRVNLNNLAAETLSREQCA